MQVDCTAKLRKLDPLVAPGPSGMRIRFLSTLPSKEWPGGSEAEQALLRPEHFTDLYMNAKLPAWHMHLLLSVR